MIKILQVAKEIDFLLAEHIDCVEKHKVFVRIGFRIDVYIVSKEMEVYNASFFEDMLCQHFGQQCKNWKIELTVMSHIDMADNVYGNLFKEKGVEAGVRHRLNTLLKSRKYYKVEKKAPVVTFYSYKGGMGRTTSLVSYAIHLAVKKKKKVFVIDCDLEAPGYLNFFDLSQHEPLKSGHKNGFVEYLCDVQFSEHPEDISLEDYIINISYGNQQKTADGMERIYLMPAGNLNEALEDDLGANRHSYIEGLSRINLADERITRDNLKLLFDKIKEDIDPDIILIDSRTGFNDIIGTATQYLSDVVVGFFGSNAQNFPGLYTLLDNYVNADYKLLLVNSIISYTEALKMYDKLKKIVSTYLPAEQMEEAKKTIPEICRLTRLPKLEKVGVNIGDAEYINLATGGKFPDHEYLFKKLNELIFTEEEVKSEVNEHLDTWSIRNKVLQNLKQTLASVKSFAELTGEIKEQTFFYRNCMNELFDESKFIISGYKGTGKTYLYRALADDSNISMRIRERANYQLQKQNRKQIDKNCRLYCLNVISIGNGNKSFEFESIDYDSIKNPGLYFKRIWQLYTWNSILLEEEFASVRNQSKLKEYIKPIQGDTSVSLYEQLMAKGIDVFVTIEEDMVKINDYLKSKNIKLFLLYDQLDTRIKPQYWDKAVSPLINYWRDKWNLYSNILPKVFVRTDLFKRVMGTNTEVLRENIINIEWSIDEIFAYFIKLVLSVHPEEYWEIMRRIGRSDGNQYGKYQKIIPSYMKQMRNNDNQVVYLDQACLGPLINTFFGSKVVSNSHDLGSPYDYFYQTLVNADRDSISLRPFINTLDKNAVEQALAVLIPNRYVKSIISSDIYASRDVRIKAANSYFDDLARDEFSHDLNNVRSFLNSEQGINYRKKTLSEEDFAKFIELVLKGYTNTQCQNADDMVTLLRANGIVDEKFIQGQKVWRFAPMYIYAWKLSSTRYDKDLSGKAKYENPEE